VIARLGIVVAAVVLVATGLIVALREPGGTIDAAPTTASPTTTTEAATTTVPTTTVTTPPTTTTTTTTPPPQPEPIPSSPLPPSPPPAPSLPDAFDGVGVVVAAAGGVDLASAPGGEPFTTAREGLVFAGRGISVDREWVRVFHMCDGVAWARTDQLAAQLPASDTPVGAGFSFADAVLVIDPGHGGPGNIGGVSPDGLLLEKEVNLLIANRVRDLLRKPHTIDWATGAILAGDTIPAAGTVILTRVGAGTAGDYEAGLDFRAAVANAANANAMVAIHNNAGWEIDTQFPGSDVYYQSQASVYEPSRRLATLLVEEFRRGFAGFEADWVGTFLVGAKSRLSPRDGVSQYYGVLKAATVPTVIAEGAYIANPSEATLLRTPEFQHAYAAAVYRALVRFITTDEPGGAPSYDPEVWAGGAGRGAARPECVIPTQGS